MARLPFSSIFNTNPDGSISPRQTVRIGGVTMTPGVSFTRGVQFGGIDITQFYGHDLEVVTDGETLVITAIY